MIETKEEIHPIFDNCPKNLEFKKLSKRIIRLTKETIHNFKMIEKQAKWLVCISGGKDSFTLLAALIELKWRGLLPVEMLVCNLDQGQPNFPKTILPKFLKKLVLTIPGFIIVTLMLLLEISLFKASEKPFKPNFAVQ